jgi:hypothetical protein
MNLWLIVSNLTLLAIRVSHIIGQNWSGALTEPEQNEADQHDEEQNINPESKFIWENAQKLKSLTTVIIFAIFPFFIFWTIIGNMWVLESGEKTPGCVRISFNNNLLDLRARALLLPYHLVDFQLRPNLALHHPHPLVVLYISGQRPIEEKNHGDHEAAHGHRRWTRQ